MKYSPAVPLFVLLLFAVFAGSAAAQEIAPAEQPAGEQEAEPPILPPPVEPAPVRLKLEFDLLDDSRLFAIPVSDDPVIRLATRVGAVDIHLSELAYFEIADDRQTLTAHWPSGDRLTGEVITALLAVETVLGELQVPLLAVRNCAIQPIPLRAPAADDGPTLQPEFEPEPEPGQ